MADSTKAIRIHRTGGPEVLQWEDVPVGRPATGQVLLRQTAVGLNFIDTYHRTGLYPLDLPAILGREAVGVIEELGDGVESFEVGMRVGYPMAAGSYCRRRTIDARLLVPLPDGVEDRQAAAVLLKGLTVQYLLRRTFKVSAGQTILIHAAAGGVGLLACQWASHLGATVIGTVGTQEKADLARAHGCHHPLILGRENFVTRVRELTDGRGVPVVYDSVGRDTFDGSLDCLEPCGLLVSFGQSSGAVPPFNPGVLAAKGSLFLTRPTLATFIASRERMQESADELFGLIADGRLRVEIGQTYPLEQAATAHRDLEARKTRGSTVFDV